MKKIPFLFACCLLILFCGGCRPNRFVIDLRVPGLAVGDKIILSRTHLFDWSEIKTDTLILTENGRFYFSDTISDAWMYSYEHKPVKPYPFEKNPYGKSVFVDAGHRLLITAPCLDSIFAPHIQGGFYDDSLIALYSKMEEDFDRNCISRSDRFERLRSDTTVARDTIMKYYEEYKNAHRVPEEMKKLRQFITDSVNDNKYAAYLLVERAKYDDGIPEMKNRFERFTPEVKSSAIGKIVSDILYLRERLDPGSEAPDFTLIDQNEDTVSLSDFKGKYLLMYHWDICPGVFSIQPDVKRLYEQFHDQGLEVLATTRSSTVDLLSRHQEDELFQSLVKAPWITVYIDKSENAFFDKLYMLQGTPMFTLISPEGIILAHDFSNAFYQSKKIIKKAFSEE
ncbi:MAG: redoxin domain-containing protein [Bacteroidales bacterium]|nr:redoxin domain-containing protein [Bacteroidales bacterium]